MKRVRLLFLFIILNSTFQIALAQSGQWAWMSGDTLPNSTGNYGQMGLASPTNQPPTRYAPAYWTDTAGNFWIFGGVHITTAGSKKMDDMWKFDPLTAQWTWVSGSNSFSGIPMNMTGVQGAYNVQNDPGSGGYGITTWVTPDNHFWIYGGLTSYGIGYVLWQYDPAINQWAWMSNQSSYTPGMQGVGTALTGPGPRWEGNAAWTDSAGNLWMFGSEGNSSQTYNDMWQFDVSAGTWTWMSGTYNPGDPGSYGTPGVPSVSNYPSARSTNLFWKDSTGNFWLSGGSNVSQDVMYQDTWKFNPKTMEWTWINGSSTEDRSTYGVDCTPDTLDKAGPRYENRSQWQLCEDLVITYGGFGDLYAGPVANDLWAYKISANEWIKLNSWPQTGLYGTQGVATASTYPPARYGGVGFKDKKNNLWMFGGLWNVSNAGSRTDTYNDVWKYTPDTNCLAGLLCNTSKPLSPLRDSAYLTGASCNAVCNGSAGIVVTGGLPPYRYRWQPTGDTTAAIANLCVGNYHITATDAGNNSITDSVTIFAPIQDPFPIIVDKYSFCSGDTAHLCAPGGFSIYTWTNADSTACIIALSSGYYSVTVKDANGCLIPGSGAPITVYPLPVDSINATSKALCYGDTATLCSLTGFVSYQWNTGDTTLCITATLTGAYNVSVTDNNGCHNTGDSIKLVVFPPLHDSLIASKTIFCPGDSARLCSVGKFLTYRWNTSDTASCISVTQAGNYYLTVTDANHCTAVSPHQPINVYPEISVSIIQQGDTLSSFGQANYQWIRNGVPIDSATGPLYVAHQSGLYALQVTDTNGCSTTSQEVSVTSGLQDLTNENVSLYPNPSTGTWQLTVDNNFVGSKLEIYDEQGRIVFQSKISLLKSKIELEVASGVYYIRISNEKMSVVRKLVKL